MSRAITPTPRDESGVTTTERARLGHRERLMGRRAAVDHGRLTLEMPLARFLNRLAFMAPWRFVCRRRAFVEKF